MNLQELGIFIASPGDLSEERDAAESVIATLNRDLARQRGLTLRAIRYEDDVMPGVGADLQSIIDEQVGDDYAILVAMFWTRLGTPTPRAASGTVEELLRAIEKWQANPTETKVLVYFKEAPVSPFELDAAELERVQEFRRQLRGNEEETPAILAKKFTEVDEFQELFRSHLTRLLLAWGDSWGYKVDVEPNDENLAHTDNSYAAALAEEDVELGLFDLEEIVEQQLNVSNESIQRMTDALESLSSRLRRRTEQIQEQTGSEHPSRVRSMRLLELAAADMHAFVDRLETELPIQSEAFESGIDAAQQSIVIYATDFRDLENSGEKLHETRASMQNLEDSLSEALTAIRGMTTIVDNLPRLTRRWNRARHATSRILNRVCETWESERGLVSELIRTIDDELNNYNTDGKAS